LMISPSESYSITLMVELALVECPLSDE
jgi:hypothetical protein